MQILYWVLYKTLFHSFISSLRYTINFHNNIETVSFDSFLLGGVESRYSRAWFCIQKIGSNTMRRRNGTLSYTRVLDLPLQGRETLQVWLGEIGAQKNGED